MDAFLRGNAKTYESHQWLKKIKVAATRRALELLEPAQGELILDVGCGTGWSTEVIRDAGFQVIGLDISSEMAAIAKKKGFDVKVGDLREMPFGDESVGHIVSISALNFINESASSYAGVRFEYEKAAKEFWRVLKKGGRVVIEYYPRTKEELSFSSRVFRNVGFSGNIVIDGEGTRKEEIFLVLNK